MFWDLVSNYYSVFENLFNCKVNSEMCKHVAEKIDSNDDVLECACGTGMISVCIAPVCNSLVATDYSDGMLRNAKEDCKAFGKVRIEKGDIMHLPYADGSFDKVVAANVIHLLDKPELALAELMRVCRKGGMVIIPTYVFSKRSWFARSFMKIVNCFTKTFVNQFSEESYKEFFKRLGYYNASFDIVEGRMACAIAFLPS